MLLEILCISYSLGNRAISYAILIYKKTLRYP